MKSLISIIITLLLPFFVIAQKSVITFEESTHDFGDIPETGGNAEYDFVFKNTGDVPLILTTVRASCGCTTPTWTREPVAPNQTGIIKVSYNPMNRPGRFTKSISVSSNAQNSVVSLTIRGNVVRKPADPYSNYKVSVGTLKLNTANINIGNVLHTAVIEKNVEIVNSGNEPVTVQVKPESQNITATVSPATLAKGEKGQISIQYDAAKKNDWDFVTDKIKVFISPEVAQDIVITANIKEDFSALKADNYANAPVGVFSETEIDLGTLEKNSIKKHEFYIENTGKTDYIIRKIKTSDNSVTVNAGKNTIKPGKKQKVIVTLKTDDKPGKKVKVISFTTNDPKNTVVSYKLSEEVK